MAGDWQPFGIFMDNKRPLLADYPTNWDPVDMAAGMLLYVLRPNPQTQARVEKILLDSLPCDFDPERTISLPVSGSTERREMCGSVIFTDAPCLSLWGDASREVAQGPVVRWRDGFVTTPIVHHSSTSGWMKSDAPCPLPTHHDLPTS
jgi:hypothetical protein